MTQQTVNNGDTGLSARTKINANFTELYGFRPLQQAAIPFVIVGGAGATMGNNGALSGITAVGTQYPNAYVYLPAGAIVTASTAGWYYAVFSSTTAATIYNNTYTTGTPAIPASPTAFATTGPGGFTQATTEIVMQTCTVPANSMGVNGRLYVSAMFTYSSTVNAKTLKVKLGSTAFRTFTPTTTNEVDVLSYIANRGATNVQMGPPPGQIVPNQNNTSSIIPGAIDTTADAALTYTGQLANAADTITLEANAAWLAHF